MSCSGYFQDVFAEKWAETALIDYDKSFSYADLYSHALAVSQWMSVSGVTSDSTVVLRLENGWQLVCCYLASAILGTRFVPLNPELSAADQEYIIQRVAPDLIVDSADEISQLNVTENSAPDFGAGPDKCTAIFFTAGTTGRPKGVLHSLSSLCDCARSFNRTTALDANTRMYHVLPMTYMAGFLNTLLSPFLSGGSVVLGKRFSPALALDFWTRPLEAGCNAIWITPTIATVIARMTRQAETISRVKESFVNIFCGTAPLTSHIRDSFLKKFGIPLQESYGMSEVLFISVQTRPDALLRHNAGRLLEEVNVSYRDAIETEKAREMLIEAPWALKGYLLQDEEVDPRLENQAMPTGDTSRIESGELWITGRLKDLIIRGGINVSPVPIEDVLSSHENVLECAVVGAPDPVWGERIVAFVVLDELTEPSGVQNTLQELCANQLAKGSVPDEIRFISKLPRSNVGKIQKYELRALIV